MAAARCTGDDRDRARAATAGAVTARGLIPGARAVAGSISVEIYDHLSRGTPPVCADSVAAIRVEAIEQRRGFLAEPAGSTERAGACWQSAGSARPRPRRPKSWRRSGLAGQQAPDGRVKRVLRLTDPPLTLF